MIRTAAAGAASLLFALVMVSPAQAQQAGIAVGATAPDATVTTLEGESVQLSKLIAGKPAVIEFWATWCPLCKQLEPAMKNAQERHGDSVLFLSVGVPQNQTPERQKAYVTEHALGGSFVFDRDAKAIEAFQVPHTSFIVVVDAAGRVVSTGVGPDQDIEAAIAKLHAGMD